MTLSHLHKVQGTWAMDSLAGLAPRIDNFQVCHFSLDLQGAPHLLVGKDSAIEEYVRHPDGTWAASSVPTGGVITLDPGTCLTGAWADSSNGWLVCESDGANYRRSLYVLREIGGAYGAPVLLGTRTFPSGSLDGACLAATPDRSGVVVVGNTAQGLSAFTETGGVWSGTLVCQANNYNSAGFDGSGRLHILVQSVLSNITDYHQ
jgi:hypothetical protein